MKIYNIIPKINILIIITVSILYEYHNHDKYVNIIEPIIFIQSIFFIILYYIIKNVYSLENRIFKQYYFNHIINFTILIFIIVFYLLNRGNRGSFLN